MVIQRARRRSTMTTTAEIAQFTAARRTLSRGLAGLLADWFLMPAAVLLLRVRAHHRDKYATPCHPRS
jgi:hypothetical protein